MAIINWFKSLFYRSATQRRLHFCVYGIHRYNKTAFLWWIKNGEDSDDSADTTTFTGRHCKDCGHWDVD